MCFPEITEIMHGIVSRSFVFCSQHLIFSISFIYSKHTFFLVKDAAKVVSFENFIVEARKSVVYYIIQGVPNQILSSKMAVYICTTANLF